MVVDGELQGEPFSVIIHNNLTCEKKKLDQTRQDITGQEHTVCIFVMNIAVMLLMKSCMGSREGSFIQPTYYGLAYHLNRCTSR